MNMKKSSSEKPDIVSMEKPDNVTGRFLEMIADQIGKVGRLADIARHIGITQETITNLIGDPESRTPGGVTLEKFFAAFPEANANYLYKGIGPKWNDDTESIPVVRPTFLAQENVTSPGDDRAIQALLKAVEDRYRDVLSEKERSIQMLQAILFQEKGISPFLLVARNTTGGFAQNSCDSDDITVIDVTSWRNRSEIGFVVPAKETA